MGRYHRFYPTVRDLRMLPVLEVDQSISVQEGKRLLQSGLLGGLLLTINNSHMVVLTSDLMDGRESDSISSRARRPALLVKVGDTVSEVVEQWTKNPGSIPLVTDDDGKPLGVLDPLTTASVLLAEFTRLRAYLDRLLALVNDSICGIDEQHRVVIWNSKAEELYGVKAETILSAPIEDFFSNIRITTCMHENKVVNGHYHQPCEGAHVLINAGPVCIGQKVIGGISAEKDITEIVHLNQELSKASSQVKLLEQEIKKISGQDCAFSKLTGRSLAMQNLINFGKKVSTTDATVLLRGESGTGKELFARAIHQNSNRHLRPFIVVNCGAIPNNLFESELFGYEGGAFTGADRKGKPGMFELANGGTIFLDEVGELPLEMQVKLLRVLQEGSFYRVGGSEPVQVNVRVLAATHRDLEAMISRRQFREDLYYRLNVVSLEIPPLRERREDIPELVHQFLQEFCQKYQKSISKIEPAVMTAFLDYSWPGNIRELKNAVERLVVLTEGEVIDEQSLPENLRRNTYISLVTAPTAQGKLMSVAVEAEKQLILKTLQQVKGNRSEAARVLGIPRSTLYYKLRQLGIPAK
ncbi:PAS modulated sigma54 specific transcriptional regulator, Fis family [Desulfotomaculum nigrificans CO-1-SRB]|uniref:PAS modulated sigma54 specific transcriptional regulator, Fis family n=1 Tax=Desulfotomaculum nigrificans (strain DSM 14880 / VKM B-2319 / CO-1-SRB) TaxID=868595 RepID=F6B4Q3_DESCC|nr:sigma-54-dependent Fis family transcriptional regulator [Desulfotomaculum nigrificans]AEF94165.1 PAS modulated sigma54 specific transcriptional regulator, Fis family [Desulfotomaculum nigrificans CO-1-SRB]